MSNDTVNVRDKKAIEQDRPPIRRARRRLDKHQFEAIEDAAAVDAPMTLQATAHGLWRGGYRDEARFMLSVAGDLQAVDRALLGSELAEVA